MKTAVKGSQKVSDENADYAVKKHGFGETSADDSVEKVSGGIGESGRSG